MLGTDSSTLRREVVPCQMDLFGNVDKRVRHPIAAMALARTEHLKRGHSHPCSRCGEQRSEQQYGWRKATANKSGVFNAICNPCLVARQQQRNEIAGQEYLEQWGCSRSAVFRYAKLVGKTWADVSKPEFIAEYLRYRDERDQSKRDEAQGRRDAEAGRLLTVEQCYRHWDSIDRLSLANAWTDWMRTSPPEWWASNGLIPPAKSFATMALFKRYQWKHDQRFIQRSEDSTGRIRNAGLFKRIDNIAYLVLKGSKPMDTDINGYDGHTLKRHLIERFTDGMTWGQMHTCVELDHIIPAKYIDMTNEAEVRAAWSLDNLQPLWRLDNRSKASKLMPEYITDNVLNMFKREAPRVYEEVIKNVTGPNTGIHVN